MATLTAKAGGGNWSAAATWSATGSGGGDSAGPPTAATDVIFEAGSGNVTIDGVTATPSLARSVDTTSGTGGYTGTLSASSIAVLTIGDGTAGAGNVAIKLRSGMVFAPNAASVINLISTSATQQTVDFGGKTMGNVNFNSASNGNYAITTNLTTAITSQVTLTQGTLHTDGPSDNSGLTHSWGLFNSSNSNVRTLTLGTSAITCTAVSTTPWSLQTSTSLVFSGASSTITCSGATAVFQGGTSTTYGTVNLTGSGTAILSFNNTSGVIANFNRTGTAAKTDAIRIDQNTTITGSFTLAGQSATNRIFIYSSSIGTQRTITNTTTTMTWSNVDLQDIKLTTSFDAHAITGNSGDCGGNSGITFTTNATQTWSGTAGGNWSANAWSGRVPLPQDDCVLNAAFVGSPTITSDMPRMGKSVDWTGATGTPTWSCTLSTTVGNGTWVNYGSITVVSGVTLSIGVNVTQSIEGRGSFTLTSAGGSWNTFRINVVSGTITLGDAVSFNSQFNIISGTFNANNFNVTTNNIVSTSGSTRAITMGTGTWTANRSTTATTVWSFSTSGLTLTSTGSTISLINTGSATMIFAGGGLTYNNLTINSSGTGAWTFTSSNTFNQFTINAPKTVTFTSATTQTINSFVATGSAGNLITINASTGASAANFTTTHGAMSCDWLDITDNSVTPISGVWFAGANSTLHSNVTGWVATSPATSSKFMQLIGA